MAVVITHPDLVRTAPGGLPVHLVLLVMWITTKRKMSGNSSPPKMGGICVIFASEFWLWIFREITKIHYINAGAKRQPIPVIKLYISVQRRQLELYETIYATCMCTNGSIVVIRAKSRSQLRVPKKLLPNIEHTKAKDTPVQAREPAGPIQAKHLLMRLLNLLWPMIRYVFT